MSKNLISNPEERKAKSYKQDQEVLIWLMRHRYSDAEVIQTLLHYKTKWSATRKMQRLLSQGLVKQERIQVPQLGGVDIWGISAGGLMAIDDSLREEVRSYKHATEYLSYEKGQASVETFVHNMMVQMVALSTRWEDGSISWITQREMPYQNARKSDPRKWATYPDGYYYFLSTNNKTGEHKSCSYAMEIERTAKTSKRYRDIVKKHFINIEKGRYTRVKYIANNDVAKDNLKRLIHKAIEAIDYSLLLPDTDEYLPLHQQRHLFLFESYQDLINNDDPIE